MFERTVWGCVSVIVVLGTACHQSAAHDSSTRHVGNPEPAENDVLVGREVLSLGSVDGFGPELFGRISALHVSPAGNLYVVDGIAQDIRIFSQGGDHIRTVGRKGSGPGEFYRITDILVDKKESAWIWDAGSMRLTVLDANGGLVSTLPLTGSWARPLVPAVADDGSFWALRSAMDGLSRTEIGLQEFVMRVTPIRLDQSLTVLDSVVGSAVPLLAVGNGINVFNIPFQSTMVTALEATGAGWFSHGANYEVFRRDASGDTTIVFTLAAATVPVPGSEVDSVIGVYKNRRKTDVERSWIPDHRPVVMRLVGLDNGGVGVFPQIRGIPVGKIFDVFSPDGEHEYRVDFGAPIAINPSPVYSRGRLYAVRTDELDVPYLVAFEWPSRRN